MRVLCSKNEIGTAALPIGALDLAVSKVAVGLNALDVSRFGVMLGGFCYRSTARIDVGFVNSVLKDLAGHDLSDLNAENEFRRAVGLSQIDQNRLPLSLTDPKPMPAPSVPADGLDARRDGRNPFDRDLGWLVQNRELILGCVFRRFGVTVPPAMSDAVSHPEMAGLKHELRTLAIAGGRGEATAAEMKVEGTEECRKDFTGQKEFWANEAIIYLGLDRLELARPDMALQRLIGKGSLTPTKIGGRLVFKRAELDHVLEKGDEVRRRGRPRKDVK